MRPLLKELFDLLSEQKSILERMLELSTEERQIIINGQADKLEDVVRAELKELSKLNAIEKKRAQMHPRLSAEFAVQGNGITVSAIAKCAQPDEREAMTELQTQLTALLNRHKEINHENRKLIEAHFEYSEAMMDIMVDSEDPLNNFYGVDGKAAQERKKATGFFDGRA